MPATRTEATFDLSYAIAIRIDAPPERVWEVLTDVSEWARWSSTITSIEGDCTVGQKLKLRVPISERTFTPRIAELEPNRLMVWSDGAAPMFKGVRTYTLTPRDDKTTNFSMEERFKGVMLPFIKKSLPDFRSPFEQFAADLQQEAEKGTAA